LETIQSDSLHEVFLPEADHSAPPISPPILSPGRLLGRRLLSLGSISTAAFYFHWLREIIALEGEDASPLFCEIKVDESYFGGHRKGNSKAQARAGGKIPMCLARQRLRALLTKLGPGAGRLGMLMDCAYEGRETRQLVLSLGMVLQFRPSPTARVGPRNEISCSFAGSKASAESSRASSKLDLLFLGFLHFALIVEALDSVNTP
jgi:hypothetical protein